MKKIENYEQEMKILIGQPKIYPEHIILEMKNFFNLNFLVKKAFLACVQYPNPKLPLRLIIGIESNNLKEILLKLEGYLTARKIEIEGLDFVDVKESPFKDYFLKIKPFYTQNILAKK